MNVVGIPGHESIGDVMKGTVHLLYVQRACAAKPRGLLQHRRLFRGFVFKIGQHVYI